MQFKREKDIDKSFPVKVQVLFRWHHEGSFPNLIKNMEVHYVLTLREAPLRKVNRRCDEQFGFRQIAHQNLLSGF
jgi:hypothetical protein